MVTLQDYNGRLKKVVGLFTQQLERKSVAPERYKPAEAVFSGVEGKFFLFGRDYVIQSYSHLRFNAGISRRKINDQAFGRALGDTQAFGAAFTNQATSMFSKTFAYPRF